MAGSLLPIRRVRTMASAPNAAEATGSTALAWKPSAPGRIATMTPQKPLAMASHRRMPTVSPSSGMASATTKNGVAKASTVARGSGISGRAAMKAIDAPAMASPRSAWRPGRRVRRAPNPVRASIGAMIGARAAAMNAKRPHATWIG